MDVVHRIEVDGASDSIYTPLLDVHQPWSYGMKDEIFEDKDAVAIDFNSFIVENLDEINSPTGENLDQKSPAIKSTNHPDVTDKSNSVVDVNGSNIAVDATQRTKKRAFDEDNQDSKCAAPRKRKVFKIKSDI
jgi:hypothetical protein